MSDIAKATLPAGMTAERQAEITRLAGAIDLAEPASILRFGAATGL
jgi:hypothetical protein